MSTSEDYLDKLLNGMAHDDGEQEVDADAAMDEKDINEMTEELDTQENLGHFAEKTADEIGEPELLQQTDEDFLKKFEDELESESSDDFLRQFELELEEEESEPMDESIESNKVFFQSIDDIVKKSENPVETADENFDTLNAPEQEEPELPEKDAMDEEPMSVEDLASQEDLQAASQNEAVSEEPGLGESTEDLLGLDFGFGDSDTAEEGELPETAEEKIDEPEVEATDSGAENADQEPLENSEDTTADDADLMDLLSGFGDDEELSDIGDMLKADETGVEALSPEEIENLSETGTEDITEDIPVEVPEELAALAGQVNEIPAEDAGGKKSKGKKKVKKDKKEKNGFLAKLVKILFGDDEEETEQKVVIPTGENPLEDLSAENLAILQELDAAGEGEAGAGAGKKKKEKKKKEKKEKRKKEKKPKEKKVKPPKPPKEKDNTPPLPKGPVILIFVMAISILILVNLGSNLVGYKLDMDAATKAFDEKDYITAYQTMAGMSVKEADNEMYQQSMILAAIEEELNSYQTMAGLGEQEMALDCLIRGVGRCNNFADEAETYGVTVQVGDLKTQFLQILNDQYGVSEEQAVSVYGQRKRKDYSAAIAEIIQKLGLE